MNRLRKIYYLNQRLLEINDKKFELNLSFSDIIKLDKYLKETENYVHLYFKTVVEYDEYLRTNNKFSSELLHKFEDECMETEVNIYLTDIYAFLDKFSF